MNHIFSTLVRYNRKGQNMLWLTIFKDGLNCVHKCFRLFSFSLSLMLLIILILHITAAIKIKMTIMNTFNRCSSKVASGGSKGGISDARPPLQPKMFSIAYICFEKLAKLYVGAHLLEGWRLLHKRNPRSAPGCIWWF